MRPGRLEVGVVGAGRVGAVLGAALAEAGHPVVAASGSSEQSVSRIETLLPRADRLAPDEVVGRAQLVVLAVPDDALAPLVSGLGALGAWRAGQIVFHTAGIHGAGVLAPAADAGALALAIHPAMTFTGTSLDLARMRNAVFAVTAPAALLPIGQSLAVEMGGEPVVVPEESRVGYHAALVHGANHVAAVIAQASQVLAGAGVEDPGRLLRPLVQATLEGALGERPGAVSQLTGPVVRGDAGTVAGHVAALADHPAARDSYRALARATAELARGDGRITPAQHAEVVAAIGEGP